MDCLKAIQKTNSPQCPLCRGNIGMVVKVYDQINSESPHLKEIARLRSHSVKLQKDIIDVKENSPYHESLMVNNQQSTQTTNLNQGQQINLT